MRDRPISATNARIAHMDLLVCGGRDYTDQAHVRRVLDEIHEKSPIAKLIEGGATGADRAAKWWAQQQKPSVPLHSFPAAWYRRLYGANAGTVRNAEQLREGKPSHVLAFPGGSGTDDMVDKATLAGVPTLRAYPQEDRLVCVRYNTKADSLAVWFHDHVADGYGFTAGSPVVLVGRRGKLAEIVGAELRWVTDHTAEEWEGQPDMLLLPSALRMAALSWVRFRLHKIARDTHTRMDNLLGIDQGAPPASEHVRRLQRQPSAVDGTPAWRTDLRTTASRPLREGDPDAPGGHGDPLHGPITALAALRSERRCLARRFRRCRARSAFASSKLPTARAMNVTVSRSPGLRWLPRCSSFRRHPQMMQRVLNSILVPPSDQTPGFESHPPVPRDVQRCWNPSSQPGSLESESSSQSWWAMSGRTADRAISSLGVSTAPTSPSRSARQSTTGRCGGSVPPG